MECLTPCVMCDPAHKVEFRGKPKVLVTSRSSISKKKRRKKNYISGHKTARKKLHCDFCNKVFPNSGLLQTHQAKYCGRNVSNRSTAFRCTMCQYSFKTQERMNEHRLSKCDTVRVFGCDVCNKMYIMKKSLDIHKTPICRTLLKPKCKPCGLSFESLKRLKKHNMKVHCKKRVSEEFLCDICGKVFTSRPNFRKHQDVHSDEKFVCKHCGKCFKSRSHLRNHKVIHSDARRVTCAECEKSFRSLKELRAHMSVHGMMTPNSFFCKICNKVLSVNFKKHLRFHLSNSVVKPISCTAPYQCSACAKIYTSRSGLRRHEVKEHLGVKPVQEHSVVKPINCSTSYQCSACTKIYTSRKSLRRHEVKEHSGVKPVQEHSVVKPINCSTSYQCSACAKIYTSRRNLRRHEVTEHSVVKPMNCSLSYQCSACAKIYTSRRNLRRHEVKEHTGVKLVHEVEEYSGVKQVKCSMSYQCLVCEKTFSSVRSLRSHEEHEHSSEEPSECGLCGKYFRLQSHLKQHMYVHTQEKTLPCTQCGRTFRMASHLDSHLKSCAASEAKIIIKEEPTQSSPDEKPLVWKDSGLIFNDRIYVEKQIEHVDSHLKACAASEAKIIIKEEPTQSSPDEKPLVWKDSGLIFNDRIYVEKPIEPVVDHKPICTIYGKSFKNSYSLKQHFPNHSENKFPFNSHLEVCASSNCKETKSVIKEEQIQFSHNEKPVICRDSGLVANNRSYLESRNVLYHEVNHTFTCNVCGKSFKNNYSLNRHSIIHSENKLQPCSLCGEFFDDKNKLLTHMNNHLNSISSFDQDSYFDIHDERKPLISDSSKTSYTCDICKMCFNSEDVLNQHQAVHSKLSNKTGFMCTICYKLFWSRHQYDEHYRTHTLEKPFKCDRCESAFIQKKSLSRHYKKHLGRNDFKCDVCKKIFPSPYNLKRHMSRVHGQNPNVTRYICIACDVVVPSKYYLEKHLLTHFDEKPDLSCTTFFQELGQTQNKYFTNEYDTLLTPKKEVDDSLLMSEFLSQRIDTEIPSHEVKEESQELVQYSQISESGMNQNVLLMSL